MSVHEVRHGEYLISDDPAKIDIAAVKAYLKRSYWADLRPEAVIEQSWSHGVRVGLYTAEGNQVGALRVITDFATFGWVCDVYVLEEHRGNGLSKALMTYILAHPGLSTVGRFMLGTRDAHSLYAQFGFIPLVNPERLMEKRTASFIPPKLSEPGR